MQNQSTANLFVDWSAPYHTPPWQACNNLPITSGSSTVQDLMNSANSCSPPITYTSQGSGASAYLESIDGVSNNQNGNGYYWVYMVNGVSPKVGFGDYVLNTGDSVVWDYKHFSSGLFQASHKSHPAFK